MPVATKPIYLVYSCAHKRLKQVALIVTEKRRETDKHEFLLRPSHPSPASFYTLHLLSGAPFLNLWLDTHCGAVGTYLPAHVLMPFYMAKKCFPALLGHCRWCWWRQWRPWQGRSLGVFLVQSHRSRRAPRHNSPGSAPKNTLSSTALLSNVCLPPVHLKLATSVPLAILTPAKHPVQSLKTTPFANGQAVPPPPLPPQNQDSKRLPLCAAFKDRRKISGVYSSWQHISKIFKPPVGAPIKLHLISTVPA